MTLWLRNESGQLFWQNQIHGLTTVRHVYVMEEPRKSLTGKFSLDH